MKLRHLDIETDELVNESRREYQKLIHAPENGKNDMMSDIGNIRQPTMREIFAERTPMGHFNVWFKCVDGTRLLRRARQA
jgi:hypothetical protein